METMEATRLQHNHNTTDRRLEGLGLLRGTMDTTGKATAITEAIMQVITEAIMEVITEVITEVTEGTTGGGSVLVFYGND